MSTRKSSLSWPPNPLYDAGREPRSLTAHTKPFYTGNSHRLPALRATFVSPEGLVKRASDVSRPRLAEAREGRRTATKLVSQSPVSLWWPTPLNEFQPQWPGGIAFLRGKNPPSDRVSSLYDARERASTAGLPGPRCDGDGRDLREELDRENFNRLHAARRRTAAVGRALAPLRLPLVHAATAGDHARVSTGSLTRPCLRRRSLHVGAASSGRTSSRTGTSADDRRPFNQMVHEPSGGEALRPLADGRQAHHRRRRSSRHSPGALAAHRPRNEAAAAAVGCATGRRLHGGH